MALISMMTVLLVTMTNSTAKLWTYTTSRSEQFRSASTAFEAITRRLSQATLNTYWDYDDPAKPTRYQRQSDLRFIAGNMQTLTGGATKPVRPTHGLFFQAPLGFVDNVPAQAPVSKGEDFKGLENLLNTWGYYLEYGPDLRPSFVDALSPKLPLRYRYRLMELMQPSNAFSLYAKEAGVKNYSTHEWFTDALPTDPTVKDSPVHVLAENIVALVILPKLSKKEDPTGVKLAPKYSYDSAPTAANVAPSRLTDPLNPLHQLPPVVQVTMVALDEVSARKVFKAETPPPEVEALVEAPAFSDAQNLTSDLTTLQTELTSRHLNFRVFTTSVSIRGARWSRK